LQPKKKTKAAHIKDYTAQWIFPILYLRLMKGMFNFLVAHSMNV